MSIETFDDLKSLPFDKIATVVRDAIRQDNNLKKSSREVYRVIYEHALSCKEAVYFSYKHIAKLTNYSVRTISRCIKNLIDEDYISVKRNTLHRTYEYTINVCSKIKKIADKAFINTDQFYCHAKMSYNIDINNNKYNNNINNINLKYLKENKSQHESDNYSEIDTVESSLNKLPTKIRESLKRIKKSIESRKSSRKQPCPAANKEKKRLIGKDTVKAEERLEAITEPNKGFNKKITPRSIPWAPNCVEIMQIKRAAIQGIKLNTKSETIEELELCLTKKTISDLNSGRAKNLKHALKMSWSLIEKNRLERPYNDKYNYHIIDKQQEYAAQNMKEHEERKRQEMNNKISVSSLVNSMKIK